MAHITQMIIAITKFGYCGLDFLVFKTSLILKTMIFMGLS